MHIPQYVSLFALAGIPAVLADFLGPTYPVPLDLTSPDSLVPANWKKLSSTLDEYLKKNQTTRSAVLSGVENVTFSAGLFSVHDPAAGKFQYHYTSPEIKNAVNGTHKVDGDSIYRVASISKLFTVFAGLIKMTNEDWNRPLTEVIPGLNELSGGILSDLGLLDQRIHWDEITPWTLASQIAGVPREGMPGLDILLNNPAATGLAEGTDPVAEFGFPPANVKDLGPCWTAELGFCGEKDFLPAIDAQPQAFLPWTTPAYADGGFVLLGLAISHITGVSIHELYRQSVFEPLGLDSSYSTTPTDESQIARSVIPGNFSAGYGFPLNIAIPSGGLLSTTNDLAKLGVGILNSTLLPPHVTRKWMKPATHTASLTFSMGAPWEITRYVHPLTGKVTDMYTKSGDSGYYSGDIILLPDYNAGFSILTGNVNATTRNKAMDAVLDLITQNVLPALEAQAAAEAQRNFVGTYTHPSLNSSVTISFNESTVPHTSSGLSISNWISNGIDVLSTRFFKGVKPRLLPSVPNVAGVGRQGQVAFQASSNLQTTTYMEAGNDLTNAPFTAHALANHDWGSVDSAHYAGLGVDLFVFDVDGEGKATAVSPAVTRAKLDKKID
ncbi:MAG: hypothetical protein LQ351_007158 [Letrouitia transgressa]|nr:MAG: hypothetical protein LQ351_007158 [Letrouitia transgressa]